MPWGVINIYLADYLLQDRQAHAGKKKKDMCYRIERAVLISLVLLAVKRLARACKGGLLI